MLVGITLISNGVKLNYPFEACIRNLSACCDKVIVNCNQDDTDGTPEKVESLAAELGNIGILTYSWNMGNTNGTELAQIANDGLVYARNLNADSVLYVQADEIVCPTEVTNVRYMYKDGGANLFLERTYFWQDLNHINLSWTYLLPRLCALTFNLKVIEDGMSMQVDPKYPSMTVDSDVCRIYHYSRVGENKHITNRVNNIDSLFHDKDEYKPLVSYEFGKNNNFESGADRIHVVKSSISHPTGIKEFYNA